MLADPPRIGSRRDGLRPVIGRVLELGELGEAFALKDAHDVAATIVLQVTGD